MKILLVEPDFPYPNKSKNKANHIHKNFVPIGLLKLGAMHKDRGDHVKIVRGEKDEKDIGFIPNEILVTSLFTYWSNYVWAAIAHYRTLFPSSAITLGGIYATLHAEQKKFKGMTKKYEVQVSKGINHEAEKHVPDYKLLPEVDYHATHMMRGCIRRCDFCGTWKLEPKITYKRKQEIVNELLKVGKTKVIFYDNNILANPNIIDILNGLIELKIKNRPIVFESQSGFDGRLLEKKPELAELIKKARFKNVRIAWDNGVEDHDSIKKQIDILVENGYPTKDISIFMIYNFKAKYEDMLKKLEYCKKWGTQITDCRFRPLDLDYDGYNPHMRNGQPEGSFYIHLEAGWTDNKIRDFRSRVRKHNIWIRYAKDKGQEYDRKMEKWSSINNTYKFFQLSRPPYIAKIEKSKYLQRKVLALNRLKNYYKINDAEPPNLNSFSRIEFQKLVKEVIQES